MWFADVRTTCSVLVVWTTKGENEGTNKEEYQTKEED